MCNMDYTGDNCEIHGDVPPVPDVCQDITCSNHGVCDKDTGFCVCNQGFAGDDCQDSLTPALCDGVDCSGNGVCEESTGECSCNDGFSGDFCEKTDFCLNVNCSGNGVCNKNTGYF